jgi:membrane protein insertase Oxa1/YidC/SpoIIIJ
MIKSTRSTVAMTNCKPVAQPLMDEIKTARADGDVDKAQVLSKELLEVYKSVGANPFVMALSLIQVR